MAVRVGAPSPLGLHWLFDATAGTAHRLRLGNRELAQNGFHLEVLDDVAGLDVVEVLEPDTTFVAGEDFAGVILEAAQRADLAFPDDAAVAHEAGAGTAHQLPFGNHRTGDSRTLHDEGLADLGAAERLFA